MLGQTRATMYARPRNVRGLGCRFPVYSIDPVYDMLPMCYRPKDGETARSDEYLPLATMGCYQGVLLSAAEEFWTVAAADSRISAQFREVCSRNCMGIKRVGEGPRVFRKVVSAS